MMKTLNKGGLGGNFLNAIKAIYAKPTVNILLNGERLKKLSSQKREQHKEALSPATDYSTLYWRF